MRLLFLLVAAVVIATEPSGSRAASVDLATLKKADLGHPFLLQVSYEQKSGRQDFRTSRSRIVTFERAGAVLRMSVASDGQDPSAVRVLASVPVERETADALDIDLNGGFDSIAAEEDRTGEDYYGRRARPAPPVLRLLDRKAVSVSRHGTTIVFDQEARTDDGQRLLVHYYLSRYEPRPDFRPFEMEGLTRFGFYETYPRWHSDRWVLYAMKFDVHEPVTFALSSAIPARHRSAVRDGVLYWNRAFGRAIVRVIDAPADVRAPSPDYNVIQWVTSGEFESTSYLQSDPLTGQILHAHVFVLPETMTDGELEQQNDHLRYIVAHEVGHALGLRHNFAPGEATTVMGYFKVSQILRIGQQIRTVAPALPYDAAVVRHVYLGAPLDVETLPAFCTDSQRGCLPFRPMPQESGGIRGGGATGGQTGR
jgi:uncharacterized protein DUF4953